MAIKYICDVCGADMPPQDQTRLRRVLGPLTVEVMTKFGKGWNSGNICHECVKRAVNDGVRTDDSWMHDHMLGNA